MAVTESIKVDDLRRLVGYNWFHHPGNFKLVWVCRIRVTIYLRKE